MRRALLWCLTIVAAFAPLAAAAAPVTTRVPVTPSVAALAGRVGMNVSADRARFVHELIRRVYSPPPTRAVPLQLMVGVREPLSSDVAHVDVPLTPELWSSAVLRAPVASEQLLAAILADRRASLLCRGLLAEDDETLAYYAGHPSLLTFIHEHASGPFAAFAPSLRIHDGRLVVPGGPSAQVLWESALAARADDPDLFIRALLLEPEARPAYLFDVLATASAESRAFALGLWITDEGLRARRFAALVAAARSSFREWHVAERLFVRPLNDLAILLLRIRTGDNGVPAPPAQQRFWSSAFDASVAPELPGEATPATHTLIDAAWLLRATSGDMYMRGDRLDQLAFGQRVFDREPEDSERAASVVREMPARRMLLLGLERLGIADPDVYLLALRQARAAAGGADRFWTMAQLQGALALVLRMHATDGIDKDHAASLARGLFAVPVEGGELHGGLLDWFDTTLTPALPRGATIQARVVAGLAGRSAAGPPIEWEGQTYRLDLAGAERKRIEEIQSHQDGPDLDAAFAVVRLARRAKNAVSSDAGSSLAAEARQIVAAVPLALTRPADGVLPPGVFIQRDGRDWLSKAADDFERGASNGDVRRIVKAGESLLGLGDILVGRAMLSLVYAVHLGDPGGPALLGGNVALRHDFGFGRRDADGRTRSLWAQPRQDFQPGVPWHVVGSLVGLDIALASLSMHRISMDTLPAPPQLQSIEREGFAVNVALLDARRLTDTDRAGLLEAVRRGRARIRTLQNGGAAFEEIQAELRLDGWRSRTIRWVLQNDPGSVENQFSLADLAWLGTPAAARDAWGVNAMLSFGCACTRFPEPGLWRVLAGRPQMAMMAAATVEMNLALAVRLDALRLPSALLPSVLATAMQDFVDRVPSLDPGDREPLIAYPRTLGADVVSDYIAATATLDGPLVSAGTEP